MPRKGRGDGTAFSGDARGPLLKRAEGGKLSDGGAAMPGPGWQNDAGGARWLAELQAGESRREEMLSAMPTPSALLDFPCLLKGDCIAADRGKRECLSMRLSGENTSAEGRRVNRERGERPNAAVPGAL